VNAVSGIPPDIYERVRELALAIVNATEAGDEVLMDVQYRNLRAYWDTQASLGRSHPFLTEALADFTEEPVEAVALYELALALAQTHSGEPTYTKMISLAERLIELGRLEQAEACLRDGRAEAIRCRDQHWINDAEELLKQLSA